MEDLFTQVGDIFVKVVTNLTNPGRLARGAQRARRRARGVRRAEPDRLHRDRAACSASSSPATRCSSPPAWSATRSGWPIHWLIPTLCVAAILGDSSGYLIGRMAGPRLFTKEKSFFFRQRLPADGAGVLPEARRQDDHPRQVHPDHPHLRAGGRRGGRRCRTAASSRSRSSA